MHHLITALALSYAIATGAYAPTSPSQQDLSPDADQGTVACWNEKAMVVLMQTKSPQQGFDKEMFNILLKSGDCLVMPDEWGVVQAKDPAPDQRDDHASLWTVRTPKGIVRMWGVPFTGG